MNKYCSFVIILCRNIDLITLYLTDNYIKKRYIINCCLTLNPFANVLIMEAINERQNRNKRCQ